MKFFRKNINILFFTFFMAFQVHLFSENYEKTIFVDAEYNDFQAFNNSVKVFDSEDIKKSNARDINDFLEKNYNIGIIARQSEIGSNSSIRFRGLGSNYSLILIDGQKINSISLGGADLSFVDMDMIERIEIFKGATSTLFGSGAIGGVVNVITKRKNSENDKKISSFAKTVIGNNGYKNYSFGSTINLNKTDINYSLSINDYDGYRENSDYLFKNVFFKINREISETDDLEFRYIYNNKEIGNFGSLSFPTPNERMDTSNHIIQANYKTFQDYGEMNFRFYSNIERQNNLDKSSFKDDLFKNNRYGFDFRFLTLENSNKFLQDFIFGYNIELEKAIEESNALDLYDYSRTINSFYTQKLFRYKNFDNTLGFRYDWTNKNYGDGISGKFSSIYKINGDENKNIFLNFGKTFRVLSFSEIFYTDKLEYKYENGYGGDFGIEYLLSKNYDIFGSISYFYQKLDNKISWADWNNPKQIQKSISNGLEFNLDFNTKFLFDFNHKFSYTYTDAKYKEPDLNLTFKEAYVPYNQASYSLRYKYKDLFVDTLLRYYDKQEWKDLYGEYFFKSKLLTDLNFGYTYKDLYFFFTIKNVFGTDYIYRLDYPIDTKEYYFGVKLKF